ncbi:MAG: hypothetical protein CM15mP65_19930 [Crocinitomicaceae bacterium]|nr:MAG: hypothetical protein CM15mP65_19930 [Crocinitomicaceae bacterium]
MLCEYRFIFFEYFLKIQNIQILLNYLKGREISKEIEKLAFLGRLITNVLWVKTLLNAMNFRHP